jgi:hypothetical protein
MSLDSAARGMVLREMRGRAYLSPEKHLEQLECGLILSPSSIFPLHPRQASGTVSVGVFRISASLSFPVLASVDSFAAAPARIRLLATGDNSKNPICNTDRSV